MNREIKFRAWHKNLKKMFKIGQITLEKGIWNFEPNDRDFIGMSIPYQPSFVLMQYTGLNDKNGKEIYEGDIVGDNKIKWIVKWNKNRMGFSLYPTKEQLYDEMPINIENKLGFKILGNIYDNPELLGGEDE